MFSYVQEIFRLLLISKDCYMILKKFFDMHRADKTDDVKKKEADDGTEEKSVKDSALEYV